MASTCQPSTGMLMPPSVAVASMKALELIDIGAELRKRLHSNASFMREGLTKAGFTLKPGSHPIIPVMIGVQLVRSGWRKYHGGWLLQFLGTLVALVGLAVGLVLMYANSRGVIEVLPGLVPAVLAAIVGLAFGWLKAPSVEGRRTMDQIDGFREYLGVAEEERLEFLHPPEKTPELFERFLPYAVALDLENTWAKRFAGVLAAAAAAGAATYSWYEGQRDVANDPVSFTERIGSDLSTTIASAASPPGSSDSGGGSSGDGSSGGGGGGGGGSGW